MLRDSKKKCGIVCFYEFFQIVKEFQIFYKYSSQIADILIYNKSIRCSNRNPLKKMGHCL